MFFIQKGADHSQQNINEIKSISHFTKMFCGFYFNGMQPFYFLTFQLNCTTGPFIRHTTPYTNKGKSK